MVNTSKILTVSYGTFSCTLEGFDDSFGTMKAIAEYFRDLAADDRYFGAEPPSPDAEMLARIAEREIARRVEAHREDNTFVLRAAEGEKPAEPKAPNAPAALPAAAAAMPAVQNAPEAQAEQPVQTPAPEEIEEVQTPQEDIPSAKSQAREEGSADAVDIEGLTALVESSASAPTHDDDDEVVEAQSAEDIAEPTVEAELVAQTAPEAEAVREAAPTPARPTVDPDSVAAKLQRIRDVVSQTEAEASQNAGDYSEDEHANDLLSDDDATEDFLADAQADIAAAFAADDAVEAKEAEAPEEAPEPAHNEVAEVEDDDDDEDDIGALLDRLSQNDDADEIDLANDAPKAETPVDEDDGDDEEDVAANAEAPMAPPIRARVVKMKKAEFEAALADGIIEEDDDESAEESSLSPEEEADLMRELAAVEAEFGSSDDAKEPEHELDEDFDNSSIFADADDGETGDENFFDDEDETDDDIDTSLVSQTVSGVARAERSAKLSEAGADQEMGRIFEETNSKLDEDEGRGRRSAIAHLRAAVQATQAERDLGGDLGTSGPDTVAYRDDLETAVRPRRPAPATRSQRPEARKPAPLKLVAEQRIDTPKPSEPVRPRRVRANDAPVAVQNNASYDDFADYIENVGAQNLSEVLEAAASYMSHVEGVEHFSRPELMSKLSATAHAETSREDRLRSFGQLLRAGKIRKLGKGRFEASEDISYRPSSRAAGA